VTISNLEQRLSRQYCPEKIEFHGINPVCYEDTKAKPPNTPTLYSDNKNRKVLTKITKMPSWKA
jgi:hypothetical protein